MFFKKKEPKAPQRGLYSEITDVSKICATCKYASSLHSVDDYMCSKYGMVSRDYTCKYYDYNRLMKRPPKKRKLNTNHLTVDDFSID